MNQDRSNQLSYTPPKEKIKMLFTCIQIKLLIQLITKNFFLKKIFFFFNQKKFIKQR